MKKKAAYKIIEAKKLVVEYYSGEINIQDMVNFKKVIDLEPNYDFNCNTVFDVRDAEIKINVPELEIMYEFLKNQFSTDGSRKLAYLTTSPNHVALSTIFSKRLSDDMFYTQSEVFSTIRAAVNWLNISGLEEMALEEIIDELKTMPNILDV